MILCFLLTGIYELIDNGRSFILFAFHWHSAIPRCPSISWLSTTHVRLQVLPAPTNLHSCACSPTPVTPALHRPPFRSSHIPTFLPPYKRMKLTKNESEIKRTFINLNPNPSSAIHEITTATYKVHNYGHLHPSYPPKNQLGTPHPPTSITK